MSDVSNYKLGRSNAIHPVGYKTIYSYVDSLPEAPPVFDHTNGFDQFTMLGNGPDPTLTVNGGQPVGDCAFVGTVNVNIIDSICTNSTFTAPSANEVVTEYLKYDHGQDQGANLNQLLAYWHSVGLPWSSQLPGYASLPIQDLDAFWSGVNAFSTGYIGIVVTQTMMTQTQNGEPWDLTGLPSDDQILGGHCVDVIARNTDGGEVVTWGQRQLFTTRWLQANLEEAHVLLTEEQIVKAGDGYGLDLEKLQAALSQWGIA